MFLIQCMADKSLCIVKESQVVCDENVVKVGDNVTFLWKKKSYEGQILKRSGDQDFLAEELKRMQRVMKISKMSPRTPQANEASLEKRKLKKPTNFSPSDYIEIKNKKKMRFNKEAKSTSEHDNQSKASISQKGKTKMTVLQPKIVKSSNILKKMKVSDSSDTSLTDEYTPDASKENLDKNGLSPNPDARASLEITGSKSKSETIEELKAKLREYEKSYNQNRIKSRASSSSRSETTEILKANVQSPKISKDVQSKAADRTSNLFSSVSNDRFSQIYDDTIDLYESSGVIPTEKTSNLDDAGRKDENYEPERYNRAKAAKGSPSYSGEIDDDDDEAQLFGQNYAGGEMVHLQDGIYCRKKVYKFATGSSHLTTHVARKLLEGVFKHDILVQCTLTGQSARAQGKNRQIEVSSLHGGARDAIIAFAKRFAKQRQWAEQDDTVIKKAMAQKLVELKQMARKNAR